MPFNGARVLSFESRRAREIGELIQISSGEPMSAPALMEVPLSENSAAFRFADRLYAGEFEMVILLTGVGTRLLGRILETREPAERFREALRRITVVARGPKPAGVLREWRVPVSLLVPEPSTWREVLKTVSDRKERDVAIQEYGRTNEDLVKGLQEQGRRVTPVPVYQWRLPEDTKPLADAVEALLNKSVQVVLFTTGVQLDHLVQFASERGLDSRVLEALRTTFIASIGPDCTAALRSHGLEPAFEPSHPKMGILVREASDAFSAKA
jgi:uroporphyrinogen-III synthase